MAKPPAGRCVHCLNSFDELTWDHVFPRAWYPDDTPRNLEKWKIPSCLPCNRKYGDLEQDLLLKLGMCIGPEEAKASGIAEKVIRSIDPQRGRDESDQAARARRYVALGRSMIDVPDVPERGVLPGFGPQPDPIQRSSRGILIPQDGLRRLGVKIVRGITWILTGRFIDKTYTLEVFAVDDETAQPVTELLEAHGDLHERGPGISVRRRAVPDDPVSAVFAIEIWGRLRLYGGVSPQSLDVVEVTGEPT